MCIRFLPLVLTALALAWSAPARSLQIVVGQVAPLSGAESAQARAYATGMQALFDTVNRAGGVNGHTFSLVSRDDKGVPGETLRLSRQMIAQVQPLVLAGYFGVRNVSELLDAGLLEQEKLVLIGYRSADLRAETPQLYNVRASLQDEVAKVTEHLATLGVTQLGLFYEQHPDGVAYVAALQDLARRRGGEIVSRAAYEAGSVQVGDAVREFLKARPQAILMLAGGTAAARFIEQYRAAGGGAPLFVYSGADMERVIKGGAESRLATAGVMKGVAIAQVVPSPYQNSRLARDFNEAVAKLTGPDLPVSYVMLEGYIAAKTIVEAVRRQGRRVTREGMAAALDSIDNLDLGGYVVGYKLGIRSGSKLVELTIISETGKIRQ